MNRRKWLWGMGVAMLGVVLMAGCSKPKAPTLTPKRGSVTSVGPDGVGLRLEFDAYNPNSFSIQVQSVKAKATFDSSIELKEITSPAAISLPANVTSPLAVDVKIPWNSLPQLTLAAANKPSVPYTVEGTLGIGGKSLSLQVPFSMSGQVTQQQLISAGVNSLPQLPGLNLGFP